MPQIRRTERAEIDIIEALVSIRSRNPHMAERFEADFEEKCRLLAQFPFMGRDRTDLAPEIRSSLVKPYVILYRPIEDGIEIIREVHGARDISSLFE